MTEPTTARIEAIARADWASHQSKEWDATDSHCQQYIAFATAYLPHITAAGYAVAPATRVLDDADVATWGRGLAALRELSLATRAHHGITDDDLARIDRILAADAARTEGQG